MGYDLYMNPPAKDQFALLYNARMAGLYRWQADRIWPHADQHNWVLVQYTNGSTRVQLARRMAEAMHARTAEVKVGWRPNQRRKIPRDEMRELLNG